MNKPYRILFLIIILIIGGFFLFYYKIRDLDTHSRTNVQFFMRNLSWLTDFRSDIPYKKNDELEYTWVFSGNIPRNIYLDIIQLSNIIEIENITLDDTAIKKETLNNLHLQGTSLLKITGKAKKGSTEEILLPPKIITTLEKIDPKKEQIKETPLLTTPLKPTDILIPTTKYNSNINNLLTIHGKNLDSIDFVNIGEQRIRPVYSDENLFVQIDKNTFTSGEYFVFYTLKNGTIITSNTKLSFEYSRSNINIANITPNILRNNKDTFIVIQGNGFDKIVSVQLNNNLILKNAEFKIINGQVAGVKIPKDLPPGKYYFNIMDTHSIYELKNMSFTITY